MLFNIVYLFMSLSVLMYTVFYFKHTFEIDLKYFATYLIFLFVFEMIAGYILSIGKGNLYLYNILTFFEFNFLFLFLKGLLLSTSGQKNVFYIMYVFNIIYIFSSFYIDSYILNYNTVASITGSILITVVLFFFFKELLNSNKILNYKKTLSFWIVFGLLVYYLGTIPIITIINQMKNISKQEVVGLFNIQIALSMFMYSCFIFGGLWSQRKVR